MLRADDSKTICARREVTHALDITPYPPVPAAEHEVQHTHSRRCQPAAWRRAVRALVAARAHPKASDRTEAVAADLAARMDYSSGTVLYDMDGVARRLGVDRATVKRHVKILRELGLLVWVRHGSRKNLRLPGVPYTATATIYAATIPPAYDHAVGNVIAGSGYTARPVAVTPEGRERLQQEALRRPRRTDGSRRRAPQSHGSTCTQGKTTAGVDTTATRDSASQPRAPRRSILGRTVTASAYQLSDRIARRLRPLHNWLQRGSIRELSWVLVDKVLDGWSQRDIDGWLRHIAPGIRLSSGWRPERPHAYLAAQLRTEHALEQRESTLRATQAQATAPNREFHQAVQQTWGAEPVTVGDVGPDIAHMLTHDDITELRQHAAEAIRRGDGSLIAAACSLLGPAEALRLYGPELFNRGLNLAFARQTVLFH